MEPEKVTIKHTEKEDLYSVHKLEYTNTAEAWGEKSRRIQQKIFLGYAVGSLKDIRHYFEVKNLGVEIEIKKIGLNYEYKAVVITSELGKKAQDIKNLEATVLEERNKF